MEHIAPHLLPALLAQGTTTTDSQGSHTGPLWSSVRDRYCYRSRACRSTCRPRDTVFADALVRLEPTLRVVSHQKGWCSHSGSPYRPAARLVSHVRGRQNRPAIDCALGSSNVGAPLIVRTWRCRVRRDQAPSRLAGRVGLFLRVEDFETARRRMLDMASSSSGNLATSATAASPCSSTSQETDGIRSDRRVAESDCPMQLIRKLSAPSGCPRMPPRPDAAFGVAPASTTTSSLLAEGELRGPLRSRTTAHRSASRLVR